MGQITILNGTNTLINSCISAGVNYSWCNKLSPKKYYQHNGAAGIYTLNTNYWFSESTEFSHSAAEIGLFVAGVVIGVVGLVAIPFTLGGSMTLVAGGATIAGGAAGAVGLAISGISIAAKEFNNSPTKLVGVQAIHDRKFIAEGKVVINQKENADGTITLVYESIPAITLRELSDSEFRALVDSGEYTEHQSKPIVGGYLTSRELGNLKLENTPVTIGPAWGGDASWEVADDSTKEGAPMQLWARHGDPHIEWTLEPVKTDDPTNNEFYVRNPTLNRYIGTDTAMEGQLKTRSAVDGRSSFHLVKSEDLKHTDSQNTGEKNWFIFIPSKAKHLAVIAEDGNTGDHTKLKFGASTTVHPMWATWKITPKPKR